MVPPVTRDNDEGETSEDRDSGVGQNGGFRRRRVRTASESMNEENKDLRYNTCTLSTFSKKFCITPPSILSESLINN